MHSPGELTVRLPSGATVDVDLQHAFAVSLRNVRQLCPPHVDAYAGLKIVTNPDLPQR